MRQKSLICLMAILLTGMWSCGPKVMIPPAIDLEQLAGIGLVDFRSNTEGNLTEYTVQRFVETIKRSQRGARIVELGDEKRVLEAVNEKEMGPEAMIAAGEKYNISALFLGSLDVSDVKPKIRLSSFIPPFSAKADVEAQLTVKLVDTEQGAIIWTDSARHKRTVAYVSFFPGGRAYFDARDPEDAYGDLINSLVKDVTRDLRIQYRRR